MSIAIPDRIPHRSRLRPETLAEAGAILRLATPIALIALVNMGMSVTDTLMVSLLFGTEALAAVAIGSDLYSIVFYLCAGIIGGVTPFYTGAVTRGDVAEQRGLRLAGWLIVALLCLLAVPLVWLAPDWLVWCGLDRALLDRGRGFTAAMALTLVPMLGVMLFRTVLTAAEKPKVFLKVTLAMLPLNAALNYVFMLGVGPLPAMGPTGSGVATLMVAVASLAILALVARRATIADASPVDAAELRHKLRAILRVGVPIGIVTVTEIGIYLGATLYAATLGAADVAAHTLTLRTAGVVYAVPAALLQAAMVRMARAEAAASGTGRVVMSGSLGLGLIFGTLTLALLCAGAAPLAGAFFDDSATGIAAAGLAAGLLVLLGIIEFAANPGLAAAGLLRGRRDTRAPMLYTLIGYWLLGAPLGLYLCEIREMGITGIWIGLMTGTISTALLTLARLFAKMRR